MAITARNRIRPARTPSPDATSSPRAMTSSERPRANASIRATPTRGRTGRSSAIRVRPIDPTAQLRTAAKVSGSSRDRN